NAPVAQLNGTVTNANGGTWSGGNGTFSPSNNVFSPTYTPTPAERAAGSVTLTLTTTGNGNCLAASDAVTITITPAPTVNAGADATVCANAAQVTLNGAFTVATGAVWSGGAGTYDPNNTTLNATYTPSLAEISAGTFTLTLTTTGNGLCNAVTDAMTVTVTPAPVVSAGPDQTNCASDLSVQLAGSVTGTATTGLWSTSGTGSFSPSPSALNATYIASTADSLAGGVTLTLSSTGNALCATVSDAMQFIILPSAVANAGADQTICGTGTSIQLNGSITGNATQGQWTTTGAGTFLPGPAAANAQYVLAEGDRTAGTLTFTWSVNSCDNAMDQMVLTVVPPSQVNAGPDQVACANALDILVNGQVSGASTTGKWTTLGTGTFTNAPNVLANIYHASAGDSLAGGVYLVLTSTGTGMCPPTSDTLYVQILPNATVNAGADLTFCANNADVQLTGTLTGDVTSTVWSTNGTGTFLPNANALQVSYIPSAVDTALHNITLTLSAIGSCNNATDAMQLTLTPAPYVNAGPDQTYCNLVDQFTLSGTISGVTNTGFWSTTGSGTFVNPAALTTTYMASPADVASGEIEIYLTSLNNGTCNSVNDRMTIYLSDGVIVNAGPDQTVCSVASSAQLSGSIQNGSPNGVWTTSGNGTFSPSPSALNAQYLFTSDDVANGTVVLTLSSVASGSCPATQDQVTLTFGNSSFAYAGADATVCANDPHVDLNGQFSGGAVGSVWSSSGSGYFSNTADPAASYTMSPADINAGSVQLTLTTVTSGTCAAVTDVMTLTATPVPTLNVGADRVVCTAEPVQLNANVSHAQGVSWTTSGTGTFLDNGALVTLYYPSVSDSISGSVELVAITNGSGPCSSVSDALTITFGGGLSAEAGPDVTACSTDGAIALQAQLNGSTTGVWTTSGTGTFSPSATALNATYQPGPADFIIGQINLMIATTNNLGCPAGKDTLVVTYHLPPTVNAGADVLLCNGIEAVQLNGNVQHGAALSWTTAGTGTFSPAADIDVCASGESVQLAGAITGPGGGVWSTNGTGTFTPDANTLNAIYVPSTTDLVFPQLQFTLTTTDNQGCPPHSDLMLLNLHRLPMANAGPDQSVCNANLELALTGTVVNATGGMWSTNGTGTFLPDANTLAAQYQPSPTDPLAGTIQLVLTTTGSDFCPATSDTAVISFSNPMQPDFTMSGFCAGSPTQFADNSITGGATVLAWNWSFSDGTTASGQQVGHVFTTAGQHQAVLTIIGMNGCTSTVAHDLTVVDAPVAGFTAEGSFLMNETMTFTDTSSGATGWNWTFGDGIGASNSPSPEYTYTEDGRYMVVQTVTNDLGCMAKDSMVVIIDFNAILPPKLPNAFSPNGDGVNDVFYVRGGPFAEMHLVIYNGWGEIIFETEDPEFGWDGKYKGVPEMNGVYTYTVRAKTINGDEHVRPGKVTLIR
ncbi:MAG TPA: PKD domain-containing protein, partial [Flavobacteriales bacterium]